VTLTPTLASGSEFDKWLGDPDCDDGVVTITNDIVCVAGFNAVIPPPTEFALTVIKAGTGGGTVTSAPAGIDCGGSCAADFPVDALVTLTPTPNPGTEFVDWAGDPDCEDGMATMDKEIVCAATFNTVIPPTLTADLSAAKTASPSPVEIGTELTYTITARNNGPDAAPGVVLTDVLPGGAGFVSSMSTQGSCSTAGSIVQCDLGTLGNSKTAVVTITVIPTQLGNITNTAVVNSPDVLDPNIDNNTSSVDTNVVGNVQRVLEVVIDEPFVEVNPGGEVSIPLEIMNITTNATNSALTQGRQVATGVAMSVELPEGFVIDELITTKGVCDIETAECLIGDMEAGETVTLAVDMISPLPDGTYVVSFRVSTTGGQEFTGNATIRVSSGGSSSSSSCAIAGSGTTKGGLAGLVLYMLIPAAIVVRRRFRKK